MEYPDGNGALIVSGQAHTVSGSIHVSDQPVQRAITDSGQRWWVWRQSASLYLVLIAVLTGCGVQERTARLTAPGGMQSSIVDDYGETPCPPDVDPADCHQMTPEERQALIDDLEFFVMWNDPDCATVGLNMIDFAQSGDMRTFPTSSNFWGWWQHANYQYPGQPEQISFEDSQFQGWSSRLIETAIHEGVHQLYQEGNEAHAYTDWYENNCINW